MIDFNSISIDAGCTTLQTNKGAKPKKIMLMQPSSSMDFLTLESPPLPD